MSVDPNGTSMCTNCRNIIPTREMVMGSAKLLCPQYYQDKKEQIIINTAQGARDDATLDPGMKALKDKLEKQGLM